MSFEDRELQCKECGQNFIWTEGEQSFYAEKGLQNTPGRCPDCRKNRRSNNNVAMAGGNRRPNGGGEARVQHTITCDACGKQATVPFVPKHNRPVYCSDCFDRERAAVH